MHRFRRGQNYHWSGLHAELHHILNYIQGCLTNISLGHLYSYSCTRAEMIVCTWLGASLVTGGGNRPI